MRSPPAAAERGGVAGDDRVRVSEGAFAERAVLVVEDNAFMLRLFARLMRDLGFGSVLTAHDGLSALAAMRTASVDLVVCDYSMAPMDGLEFVRLVRRGSASPNPDVPVIMVTAHAELFRIQAARDAGIDDVLVKPVSSERLYGRIRAVLANPRPFVKVGGYSGPDRRRRERPYPGRERRAEAVAAAPGSDDAVIEDLLHQIEQAAGIAAYARSRPFKRAAQIGRIATLGAAIRDKGAHIANPVIERIGHSLWAFCESLDVPEPAHVEVVQSHVDALKAVMRDSLDGGATGELLAEMLQRAAAKHGGRDYRRLDAAGDAEAPIRPFSAR